VNETRQLAQWVAAHRPEQLPDNITHEAKRALLNYLAAAFGGCRHTAVEIAVRTVLSLAGSAAASLIGRSERCDPLHATFINGISSHVDDFDDTLPKNYIHPTSPVASALFAYGSANPLSGRAFLHAFVLGFEVTSRVGNVVYPWHYETGWHITATAGVFGAAAAIGKVRNLPAEKMIWALGLAATQSAGVRETFGSMAKAMHPGRAGQNGYFSALLAENGFTSGEHSIEGARGFAFVQSVNRDLSKLLDKLGERYELPDNTYKPFPTGIVIQPAIDACIQIHREHHPDPALIQAVELEVAPIVFELCMKKDLKVGLEGKFSIYHAAAIGLVRGRASLDEFTDAAVADSALLRIRELTVPRRNPKIADDEVLVTVTMQDGTRYMKHVEHAVGNVERPMTDAQLEDKFRDLATRVIDSGRAERIIKMCWAFEQLADSRELIELAIPV
jgi:2-methylcitrate dehydratase PrpD